ncbi:hypothetical protein Salat_1133000 [Sesamum alatum]|uniref:Uncharacterized protein n=1 Tax=Sesamum alatum TaxID=300844 RepID=A0AAE1YDP0_9LAMI|nr:hypothetical protein Salat_1133000 [Sesamum alatum]
MGRWQVEFNIGDQFKKGLVEYWAGSEGTLLPMGTSSSFGGGGSNPPYFGQGPMLAQQAAHNMLKGVSMVRHKVKQSGKQPRQAGRLAAHVVWASFGQLRALAEDMQTWLDVARAGSMQRANGKMLRVLISPCVRLLGRRLAAGARGGM